MGRKVQVWVDEDHLDLEATRFKRVGVTQLLRAPRWDPLNKQWTTLANVDGMLAIVEVRITAKPNAEEQSTEIREVLHTGS